MIKSIATASEHNSRLDRFLRKRLPLLGLSEIYGFIRKGAVCVNGKKVKQDYRINEFDVLEIDVNESEFSAQDKLHGQDKIARLTKTEFFARNFHVLYEDTYILACNKPAGLVVHSGSGHAQYDNLVDLATAYILSTTKKTASTSIETPVLMHRLDRDTSGVIVLAKNKGVVRALHNDMRDGKFKKQYAAICHNRPPEFEGTVTFGIKRTGNSRTGMKMGISENGNSSNTSYQILAYQNDLSQLEIILHTGKTHQIRVHMAYLGAPVLGDVRYGNRHMDSKVFSSPISSASIAFIPPRRLYLHAHKLSFPHPQTGRMMTITAKLPEEFSNFF